MTGTPMYENRHVQNDPMQPLTPNRDYWAHTESSLQKDVIRTEEP